MSDPVSRIIKAIPADFFKKWLEYADAAFGEALTLSRHHVDEPERPNVLGQLRHARSEAGFRRAAEEARLAVFAPHTEPVGSRYSLATAGDVHLIRGNVQIHCGPPRPSKFRKTWAKVNEWLNPTQLDLLRQVQTPSADRLCAIMVTSSNPKWDDQSIPAFVGLGVPRADLSQWVVLEPISALLGHYHDAESAAHKVVEAPVDIKDVAKPKLKKQPK
jgi:hypothetical protein